MRTKRVTPKLLWNKRHRIYRQILQPEYNTQQLTLCGIYVGAVRNLYYSENKVRYFQTFMEVTPQDVQTDITAS